MSAQSDLIGAYQGALMNTFGPPKRVFVRGEGARVFDADGNTYTDLLSGLAVTGLGHNHPDVTRAITDQVQTLGHVSNFFATPPQIALAARLDALSTANAPGTPARVFFTNSGTEANEAAFKATRRTGRTRIVAMEGSFHGRTMGALAITHNEAYRTPFEPLPGEVVFVPYGDVEALAAATDEDIAAIVCEPIQGENGVVDAGPEFLRAARQIATASGALLWLDEVQTGIGRCGDWLAHTSSGVTADLVTVAKGLGNGFPVGACIAVGPAAELLQPGNHGTTFGGNPVAAAAGLAVLDVIERDGLLSRARELGNYLKASVEGLGHPLIDHVRGRGLLRGIVLSSDIAPGVADAALAAGWIINAPRPGVLRIAPPLVIAESELERFVNELPELLESA